MICPQPVYVFSILNETKTEKNNNNYNNDIKKNI